MSQSLPSRNTWSVSNYLSLKLSDDGQLPNGSENAYSSHQFGVHLANSGSGNRDEEIDRTDEFIVDRAKPRQHLAFGAGIHRCVGDRLTEQQIGILKGILQRDLRFEIMGQRNVCARISFAGLASCR